MILLFIILASICSIKVQASVSCIGEDGKAVDMFIMYKLPRKVADPGNHYTYLDSNDMTGFKSGKSNMVASLNPAGRTLQQVYSKNKKGHPSKSQSIAHIFYNDAPPKDKHYSFTYGHTKGQLAFDKESGFWIIQSVPRYPTAVSDGYGYPRTGLMYGQMLMCVTFASSTFNEIGTQLKYTRPHIYDSNIPSKWVEEYKEISDVIKGVHITRKPLSRIAKLKSHGGVSYTHFGKTGTWHKDLYHHLLAPTLQTDLIVETWQHGHGNLGPSCKGTYKVVDASDIYIETKDGRKYGFPTMSDHSKFAISATIDSPFVCVGDINRQYSQYKRGGGCICIEDSNLWKTFSRLISKKATCP